MVLRAKELCNCTTNTVLLNAVWSARLVTKFERENETTLNQYVEVYH